MTKDSITIRVTRDDIKNGIPDDVARCPIARAIRRATGTRKKVSVDVSGIEIGHVGYEIPESAVNFIADFDAEGIVKPFTFVAKKYDADF